MLMGQQSRWAERATAAAAAGPELTASSPRPLSDITGKQLFNQSINQS